MKIFVAGATGVLGRSAVSRFIGAGHAVTGVARGEQKAAWLHDAGAGAVSVDLFDADAVRGAVSGHDVVCNFATHIPSTSRLPFRAAWRQNDRLHAEASGILVDAALAASASRYLQHSSGFMYADGGDQWLDEDAPISPPPHGVVILEAEKQAARFAEGGGTGVALRFGFFYGPDAGTTRDQLRMARMRVSPAPGRPEAYYPSIHTDDLGTAAVAALRAPSGAYNITDDEPLTRRDIADTIAAAIGVRKLRVMPMPLSRMNYVARSQRVSNKRFKDATGWAPMHPSAREGWPAVIAAVRASR